MARQFSNGLPAREAKEVAVLYGGVCWELMLELGGLADARPIHIKQQCTTRTFNDSGSMGAN